MMTLAIFLIILYHHLPKGLCYVALYVGTLVRPTTILWSVGRSVHSSYAGLLLVWFFSKLYIWHSTLFPDDDVTFTLSLLVVHKTYRSLPPLVLPWPFFSGLWK